MRGVANAPGQMVGAVAGRPEDEQAVDLDAVRSEVVRLADRIVTQLDKAAFVFTSENNTPEAYERALTWRIETAERALEVAAYSRPVEALANLVAMCTYSRRVHELYWLPLLGEADRPVLEIWIALQEQALEAVDGSLPEKHSQELRAVLDAWAAQAQEPDTLLRSGAPNFADLAASGAAASQSGSLLGIFGLDPLDSLEPATREIARARELGERAVFLAQRLPRTIAWRTELLTLRTAQQPSMQALVGDVGRTSRAVESAAATAETLPKELGVEADKLLKTASGEITLQREALVAELDRNAGPLRELLAELRQALEAGTRLSDSLKITTQTVDQFVANVSGPDEPEAGGSAAPGASPGVPPGEPAPEEPPGKPFDPVEYQMLATEVSVALRELNTTVTSVDRSLPALQRAVDEAAARVDRSVADAWRLAVWLVVIGVAAVAAGVLLVRRLSPRRSNAG